MTLINLQLGECNTFFDTERNFFKLRFYLYDLGYEMSKRQTKVLDFFTHCYGFNFIANIIGGTEKFTCEGKPNLVIRFGLDGRILSIIVGDLLIFLRIVRFSPKNSTNYEPLEQQK